LDEHVASIFRIKEEERQETSIKAGGKRSQLSKDYPTSYHRR
jgi:hypothetical protein